MPMTKPEECYLPDNFMQARYDVLEAALKKLEIVCDPYSIRKTAHQLWSVLEKHYAEEEDPWSPVTGIREIAAHRQADLIRLRLEHQDILDQIAKLVQLEPSSTEMLRSQALQLIGRVRNHEAREAQAFFDGLYTDLGGLG